jgi:hypothetical protein
MFHHLHPVRLIILLVAAVVGSLPAAQFHHQALDHFLQPIHFNLNDISARASEVWMPLATTPFTSGNR